MVCQNLNVQLQGQRVKLNLYTLLRLFHEYSLPEGLASIAWGTSNKVIPCIPTSPPPNMEVSITLNVQLQGQRLKGLS